jgi:hypothetical protein
VPNTLLFLLRERLDREEHRREEQQRGKDEPLATVRPGKVRAPARDQESRRERERDEHGGDAGEPDFVARRER